MPLMHSGNMLNVWVLRLTKSLVKLTKTIRNDSRKIRNRKEILVNINKTSRIVLFHQVWRQVNNFCAACSSVSCDVSCCHFCTHFTILAYIWAVFELTRELRTLNSPNHVRSCLFHICPLPPASALQVEISVNHLWSFGILENCSRSSYAKDSSQIPIS